MAEGPWMPSHAGGTTTAVGPAVRAPSDRSAVMAVATCADRPLVTPTGDPIMAAKLRRPPSQPWIVARPRLLELVSEGVAGPLTLVSAPAGSGKTVLAASWADGN